MPKYMTIPTWDEDRLAHALAIGWSVYGYSGYGVDNIPSHAELVYYPYEAA